MSSVPRSPPSGPPSSGRSRNSSHSGSSVPVGLLLIVGIGAIGMLLNLLASLALLGMGGGVLGLFTLFLTAVQAVVLVGLLRMRLWALVTALLFYGLSAIVDLIRFNAIGLCISIVVVAYLLTIIDEFD